MKNIKPEIYFIKYAYPCAHILRTVRGEVSKKEFSMMEDAAINNKILDKEFLEKTFFRAFTRISQLAKEMKKDKWGIEVIKEYFRVRHNPVLDASDYPESFKEQCKVFEARVKKLLGKGEAIVEYENKGRKSRRVKTAYLPDTQVDDKVTIHWSYIVEKI